MVQVQAVLVVSLAASLLSAFFAMLGKQWLNQYASTDMRGTAIERSQNRQRKLDGTVAWYFDYVMECPPLMLQMALLLIGCALSRYLWEVNIVVASVVIGATSFGAASYVFIVIAGTASESCPYQTPGARILRYILRHILPVFASSWSCRVPVELRSSFKQPWYSMSNVFAFLLFLPSILIAVATDVCRSVLAILRWLVVFIGMVYHWAMSTSPQTHALDRQTAALGLRCVSWMLHTSLDKAVRLSALEHLATMTTLAEFNPVIVVDCFNAFIGCINVSNDKVAIVHGSEQLATVSAMCFLRTFHRLSVTDPASGVLEDVRRRYCKTFPFTTDFWDLPLCYTMAKIHDLVNRTRIFRRIQPGDYVPFTQEHIPVARGMAEGAQIGYQQTEHRKVPRWTLRFALHSLSLDPLPPISVVADCLSIVAIDLGCDITDTGFTVLDERCVHFLQTTTTLTLNQCTSGTSFEANHS